MVQSNPPILNCSFCLVIP